MIMSGVVGELGLGDNIYQHVLYSDLIARYIKNNIYGINQPFKAKKVSAKVHHSVPIGV